MAGASSAWTVLSSPPGLPFQKRLEREIILQNVVRRAGRPGSSAWLRSECFETSFQFRSNIAKLFSAFQFGF